MYDILNLDTYNYFLLTQDLSVLKYTEVMEK